MKDKTAAASPSFVIITGKKDSESVLRGLSLLFGLAHPLMMQVIECINLELGKGQ